MPVCGWRENLELPQRGLGIAEAAHCLSMTGAHRRRSGRAPGPRTRRLRSRGPELLGFEGNALRPASACDAVGGAQRRVVGRRRNLIQRSPRRGGVGSPR